MPLTSPNGPLALLGRGDGNIQGRTTWSRRVAEPHHGRSLTGRGTTGIRHKCLGALQPVKGACTDTCHKRKGRDRERVVLCVLDDAEGGGHIRNVEVRRTVIHQRAPPGSCPTGHTRRAVHPASIDTDMAAGIDVPMKSTWQVVERTLDGVEAGIPEVLADDTAAFVKRILPKHIETFYPKVSAPRP